MVAVVIALIVAALVVASIGIYVVVLASLVSLGILLWGVVIAYGASFMALYSILGEANLGWAILGAMGLGTVLVSLLVKTVKRWTAD
jgi:hypothetical protein